MKVSLNSHLYNYNQVRFSGNSNEKLIEKNYTSKEITVAKTKKAVSECVTIALGVGILYFAMKRNFKINKIKNQEKKLKELAGFQPPKIKINPDNLDEFIKV